MAATAWALYNKAKGKIGNGTIKLGVDTFRMHLYQNTSNANSVNHSVISQLSNESTGGGYANKAIASATWASISATTWRFDSNNVIFSASGSDITNVLFAVVRANGASALANHAFMWSQLTSTGIITVSNGNTLTIQIHAQGYFELT